MKKISIMQPTCFPWLGYFSLINSVDEFVFLDNVQFQKRSWQQRNRIKVLEKEKWLTMSVHSKGKFDQYINEVTMIESNKVKKDILKTIYHAYRKSKNFHTIFTLFEKIFLIETNNLAEFNVHFIKQICNFLQIKTPLTRSSNIASTGTKDSRLVSICINRSAMHYISPPGSEQYIVEGDNFFQHNIQVSFFHFEHPIYNQLGKTFIKFLSIIDCLMNEDIEHINYFLGLYKLRES